MRSIHFCRQKSFWWQWFLFLRTVDASFQFYGQLEHVDFSYNQMTELPDKCFAKQSKLKHLQMDFNSIGNITNQTFLGLKSLTYLSLRGNKLSNLNEELAALTEVIHTYILISMFQCFIVESNNGQTKGIWWIGSTQTKLAHTYVSTTYFWVWSKINML